MYATVQTRVNIAYSISVLSRFLVNPSSSHLDAGKRVNRYLSATKDDGVFIEFRPDNKDLNIKIYSDSD